MASSMNSNMFHYAINEVPSENGEQVVVLPLNLIALIISYVSQTRSSKKTRLTN